MKNSHSWRGAGTAALVFLALGAARAEEVAASKARVVEMAICLDTSGSMQGLIDAARRKLWAVVNDLALAKPTPKFRVALLTYGNNGHAVENGWVRVDSGLTDDLDKISQQLFALTTDGGSELVGRVVDAATRQLQWSPAPDALKIIFVAGNETADQDREIPYRDACKRATAKGIQVNAIYCGGEADADAAGWREVAALADGQYMAIDHDNGTVAISTPFDEQLAALSVSLNATYLPIGAEGERGWLNQKAQDDNAGRVGAVEGAERGAAKASTLYRCSWDLVDACKEKEFKLEALEPKDLPEALRGLTLEALREKIDEAGARRGEIQKRIQELDAKRRAFVEAERAKNADAGQKAFDKAVRDAIRSQACAKGFAFEE